MLEDSDWSIESNKYGHYVVFNASRDHAAQIVERLRVEFGVVRWDASYRPAANGTKYDWFARLGLPATTASEDVARLVSATLRIGSAPSSPTADAKDRGFATERDQRGPETPHPQGVAPDNVPSAVHNTLRVRPGRSLYMAWNEALADTIYPPVEEARPAYLELNLNQRQAVAEVLEFDAREFDRELAACLRTFLDFNSSGPAALFERVNRQLYAWRRQTKTSRSAPPVLPLLSLLSIAAERMSAGEGMAETNFYGRVLEVLEVSDRNRHFEHGYRQFGEDYWHALERWLEDNDGLRGLPTAVAIGHRFVGLPISQVLVREGDRARFPNFFMQAALPPAAVIPASELEPALDRWIRTEPCPVSQALAHHWQTHSTRARILDVVSTVLATWDGHIGTDSGDASSVQASLALNIGTFPKKRLEFSPIAYLQNAEVARSGEIKTSRGWAQVDLAPFAPGIVRIGQQQTFDNSSLLGGVLEVLDPLTNKLVKRQPRRLMVFRRVELAGAFLEADQVMLGEDVFVVARDEPRLIGKIHEILDECARTGWEPLPGSFDGFPDGWRIYRNVQIFKSPGELIAEGQLDLRALAPITNNQLIVAGGFALPGSVRGKWHRDALPEARAVSDDPEGFELRLLDYGNSDSEDDTPNLLESWSSPTPGALIAKLGELELKEGNYRIELKPNGAASAVSAITMRVRSGDTVDEKQREKISAADQFLDDPLSVLSASDVVGERSTAGAILYGATPSEPTSTSLEVDAHWVTARSSHVKSTIALDIVPPDSCLYSGAHHTHIETVQHDQYGRPLQPYVIGTCQRCGLTRRFPSSHWRARKRRMRDANRALIRPTDEVDLPAVDNPQTSPTWDIIRDAVFHCGAGTMRTFERIAMFAEPSALMVDHLIRTMSALGHIDVLRDPTTLALESWDTSPPALVPTVHGWYLAGYWPRLQIRRQRKADPRIRLRKAANPEGPTSYYFDHLPETLVAGVELGRPAIELAVQLPPLSQVIDALPRVPATAVVEGLTSFDPVSAKWQGAAGMEQLGAYRIRHFSTDDYLRTRADLDEGTMATSTVQLSKHAAALLWGRKPLLAYDPQSQILRVPLGANLPGLYERAVVLASGIAPRPSRGSLEYRFVPSELAGHIGHLLSN